jgi:hypothetical protein
MLVDEWKNKSSRNKCVHPASNTDLHLLYNRFSRFLLRCCWKIFRPVDPKQGLVSCSDHTMARTFRIHFKLNLGSNQKFKIKNPPTILWIHNWFLSSIVRMFLKIPQSLWAKKKILFWSDLRRFLDYSTGDTLVILLKLQFTSKEKPMHGINNT